MDIELLKNTEVIDRAEINDGNVLVKYNKTEAELSALRAKHEGVVFDLTTTKGDKEARAARLELVTLRTSLEKKRKEFKAPALDLGGKIDSEAKRVTAEIVKLETFIDQQIKADETRRANEKAERERIESERVLAIKLKIAAIGGFVQKCNGISAERISNGITLVGQMDVSAETFFEFTNDAVNARADALVAMGELHATALSQEAEAARVEAQRIENLRIADEQRIQAEALAAKQAELDKQAKAIEDAKASMLLEQERIARLAEMEKQLKEFTDAPVKGVIDEFYSIPIAVELSKSIPEPEFVQSENELLFNYCKPDITVDINPECLIPSVFQPAPDMKLGDICFQLGLAVTTDFLSNLGFDFTQVKQAKMYQKSDMPKIAEAVGNHCLMVSRIWTACAK
jgi:hypothetical protein